MKKNQTREINIMYGLPGSGKTHYCSKVCSCYSKTRMKYINVDKLAKDFKSLSVVGQMCNSFLSSTRENTATVYVDGLFTTKKDLEKILNAICPELTEGIHLCIDVWNEDRETCEKNDFRRRNTSSNMSIKNMPYDKMDYDNLREVLDKVENSGIVISISVMNHSVRLKPEYKRFFDEKASLFLNEEMDVYTKIFNNSDYLYSDSWCGGGTMNTYTGSSYTVQSEEPKEFTQFIDLLLSIDEKLPFVTYLKIQKECVTIEESFERDYYGGSVTNYRWKLDLKHMYDILNE